MKYLHWPSLDLNFLSRTSGTHNYPREKGIGYKIYVSNIKVHGGIQQIKIS